MLIDLTALHVLTPNYLSELLILMSLCELLRQGTLYDSVSGSKNSKASLFTLHVHCLLASLPLKLTFQGLRDPLPSISKLRVS